MKQCDLMEQRLFVNGIIRDAGLVEENRVGVVVIRSIGDFYCMCRGLKAAEEDLGKHFVVFCRNDQQVEIAGWFKTYDFEIETYLLTEEQSDCILRLDKSLRDEYKNILFHFGAPEFFAKYTCNTHPKYGESLSVPAFPKFDAKSYGVTKGKTIFIIPQSGTVSSFPKWFWEFSGYLFRLIGFDVIYNASDGEYEGKCVMPPLSEVVVLADYCGYVYGVRTGLVDVLSTSTARMVIFSTSSYRPLDEVFGIPNDDRRIITINYEEKDPFFEKTNPYSIAMKYFDAENFGIREEYRILSERLFQESSEDGVYVDVSSYKYEEYRGKTILGSGNRIAPQIQNMKYLFREDNGLLILKLGCGELSRFIINVMCFVDDECVLDIKDNPTGIIVYAPEKNGEAWCRVSLTDRDSLSVSVFDTKRVCWYGNGRI